jgi:exonuclease SbcC
MRLHNLDLTAIGPYATQQHIDFARLAGSGLFLLEGPTGAGKTTILDAITFALYGSLSSEASGGDRLHSDFAAPDVEPSVTLEFAVSGVRYRVRRSPEYLRPRRRGEGFTKQAAQVHLERREHDAWTSLSSNKAEAGELITEFIGLNRDQFTQVMLLPQGEFAKFLRSDDDGRRELLTKLFGTQLYDRITSELERRRQEATAARRAAEVRIGTATAAAAEAAGLDETDRDDLLALTRAERATRLKEVSADLARTIAVTRAAQEVAATRLSQALATTERSQRQAALMTRLTEARTRLAEHEATRPDHELLAARLEAGRQAEPVRPLLAALAEAEAVTHAAREELAELVAEIVDAHGEDRLAVLIRTGQTVSGLGAADRSDVGPAVAGAAAVGTGEDSPAGGGVPRPVGGDAIAAALLGSAAVALAAAARAETDERLAASLEHLADAEAALPGRTDALASLRAAAAQAADRVTAREAAKLDLPAKITTTEGRLAEARMAAAGLAAARDQQADVEARLAAAAEAAELAGQLAELDAIARAAVDLHQQSVDAYQRAMEERLENMAAELAEKLAEGGACPVCGSTDHPGPAAHLADAVSADDVGEAAARRDTAADARAQAETDRDGVAAQVADAVAAAGGATVDSLVAARDALAGQILQADQAAAEAGLLEPELADLRAERDQLDEDLMAAVAAAATARQQADDAAAELARLAADLSAGAEQFPSVRARQQALRQAAAADRALSRALAALAAATAAEHAAQLRAARELQAGRFPTLAAARAAVLPPEDQASLAQQAASWAATLAALTAAATADDLAGLDPGRADEIHLAAELAADALVDAQDADRDVREACQTHTAMEHRLRQRMTGLRQAEEAADRLDEETETVIRLAGLARGMEGHRRIALTTYVLRRWFEQVVQAANVRLAAMSTGRYELRRTDDAESKRQRTGLTLAVIDRHTGEERSPKSLSGGETFYTSHALALGLADVVRAEAGGVELDTLFIDEGFGSLDTQTLDQVMAVIDDLRDRGRAVGIVSHVADLKERVYERLEIRRLPDGSSTTRVVA